MLSKEEHKTILDSLQEEGADILGISLMLMDNYDSIETVTAVDPAIEAAMQQLTSDNQMLRQRNTELFLRLGKEPEPEEPTEPEEPEEPKKVTYEDIGV